MLIRCTINFSFQHQKRDTLEVNSDIPVDCTVMNQKAPRAVKPFSTKKENGRKFPLESFHEVIRPCIVFSQFLGMLPVSNVSSNDPSKLHFEWKSLRVSYAITFLVFCTIDSCLGTRRLLRLGFNIGFAESLLFFISGLTRAFLIFRIAIHWREIMNRWRDCEKSFLYEPYAENPGWKLRTRIRVIFFVIVIFSFCK